MKLIQTIAIGGLAGVIFAASAQQQSPYATPALGAQTGTRQPVGGQMVLNLTGLNVTDAAGQPIGPIQHVTLSPAGCIDMAVLSLGGQKLVPVPWQLVGGAGAVRGETEIAGSGSLALKVDRAVLQQAPSFSIAEMSQLQQPQYIQEVQAFYARHQAQQQPGTAAGGTGAQTGVNVGVGVNATNRVGVAVTNTTAGANTNQTGILSPTGPTNAIPGRPAFETNQPGTPGINPNAPANRPPLNRPPTTPPPVGTPGQPGQP